MFIFKLTLAALWCNVIFCKTLENEVREGKMFGYRYTSTQTVLKMITSFMPSSCVQVEPSLPPCRNVRNMDAFPRFLGGRMQEGEAIRQEVLPSIHTTALGWGEYLGIYAPTVTVTAVNLQTTTVLDPKTIVTFSVRGCKPSRLPLDLDLCPKGPEIKPSPTTLNAITTTTIHNNNLEETTSKPDLNVNDFGLVQPAEETLIANQMNNLPTEQLPNV